MEDITVKWLHASSSNSYQDGEDDNKKSIFGGERSRIGCSKHVRWEIPIGSKKSYLTFGIYYLRDPRERGPG